MADFVNVKPLRTFDNGGGLKTIESPAFPMESGEAKYLQSVGLVEIANEEAAADKSRVDEPNKADAPAKTEEPVKSDAPAAADEATPVNEPATVKPKSVEFPVTHQRNAGRVAK